MARPTPKSMTAEPRWFGPSHRPLLGWYEPPRGSTARNTAVVLCPPFGYEAICTHWAFSVLARLLADAGFPTLRFDYDGTGDSAGSDRDPERVEAWLTSIAAAVAEARAVSGLAQVSLFGLRLGATLAARAASDRVEVASLILWAPLMSGRAYTRELKMFRESAEDEYEATSRLVPSPLAEGDEESAGFYLSKKSIEALGRLNLAKLARSPAPAVLVIDRDDLPENGKLAEVLTAGGALVTRARVEGYAGVMADPHKSEVPHQVFARARDWLEATHGQVAAPPPVSRKPARVALIPGDGATG